MDKQNVVGDTGLLSTGNMKFFEAQGYEYVPGARIKNEPDKMKKQIFDISFQMIKQSVSISLIVAFSNNRAAKDQHNRNRGLQRLEE